MTSICAGAVLNGAGQVNTMSAVPLRSMRGTTVDEAAIAFPLASNMTATTCTFERVLIVGFWRRAVIRGAVASSVRSFSRTRSSTLRDADRTQNGSSVNENVVYTGT